MIPPDGTEIPAEPDQLDRTRLLIIEPDRTTALRMVAALGRECCSVIESLDQLCQLDLAAPDVVICSTALPDGSGLDALEEIRRRRPNVPVILSGDPGDAAVAVEAIRAGALDFLATNDHDLRTLPLAVEKCLAHHCIKEENERLDRDLSRLLRELAVKNQQLQTMIRQLEAMTRTDDLTRLGNRRWLNEMLERAWAEAVRHNRGLGFMMIDLDGFKAINDRMGHQRGDEVLRETGDIIRAKCRQEDVPARYGGDEFCVLMLDTDPLGAVKVAERILAEHEWANAARPPAEPRIGMSIGVCHSALSRPASPDEIIHHADEALYAAKSAGKKRVMVRGATGVFAPREGEALPCAKAV